MKRLDELFEVWYGVNLEVVNCDIVDKGIPFVSRQSTNNGVVCHVAPKNDVQPNPANTLSIAVSGTVLSTFFHDYEYYSGRDIYVARPLKPMSKSEMLFYAYLIEQNQYRYNYGRSANNTFRSLLLPDLSETNIDLSAAEPLFKSLIPFDENSIQLELNTLNWREFSFDEIFIIKKGFYNKKPEHVSGGDIPFIGATDSNNGITSFCDLDVIEVTSKTGNDKNAPLTDKIFEPNCITVSNNGSIGYAFYQDKPFTCSHDVNPLYLKNHTLNKYIALFLCTIIEQDRYRWTYGRKWRPTRMPSSKIKLPVTKDGEPDWDFMEHFI